MNGNFASNQALLGGVLAGLSSPACDVAVCAPAPYLEQCRTLLKNSAIAWGAQDVSLHEAGAYTGEVAASMLVDFGSTYVIVGHSERRTFHQETDEQVAKKCVRALAAGLIPIACVGESLAERESGATEEVVGRQADVLLESLMPEDLARVVIAYEPVWAIGTGRTATPEMAQEVHALIRSKLVARSETGGVQTRILYGGSMKPDNAASLLAMPDIDGGLIGGASLKSEDFLSIIRACH